MRATIPNSTGAALQSAKYQAQHAAHEAKPWVERLARIGFAARGVVYIIVGWLAFLAAFGIGGKKTTANGALATIAGQPFGKLMLAVVALGLVGYAVWRIVQGIVDPEHKGTDAKGLAKRFGYVLSGVTYAGLALASVQIIRGADGVNRGQTQDMTAALMARPFGQWIVGAIGLVIIAVGINTIYIALKEKYRDKLKLAEMSPAEQRGATIAGKIGLICRAVVSGLIGLFLIQAARHANPNEARGLDGALKALAQQPYGPWLLSIVALGLMAFGVYSFVEARYRRIMGSSSVR
jgi:hypothetical protein